MTKTSFRAFSQTGRCCRPAGTRPGRAMQCRAVMSQPFLGKCPPHAVETVQAIREAVAHSTCGPYTDIAVDDTLVINPPWADEPRTMGLSDAVCGVDTDTKYAEEHVRPIAASYETDGSVFLLWERKAKYSDSSDGKQHSEDICGVTYVKKNNDGNASVIATFRQPTPEEKHERFKPDSGHIVRPGADNFFDGGPYAEDNPVAEQQMVAAAREYYRCFSAKNVEAALTGIAAPSMHLKDVVWETQDTYMPVNRVEAAMWMERKVKNSEGKLEFTPKAVAHAEGTNMVFVLWFAEGMGGSVAGIDLFFFGEDLKIRSVASFNEAAPAARQSFLKHA